MVRLQPAEAWQLQRHYGLSAEDVEGVEVAVQYQATQLMEGDAAEAKLGRFAPGLKGRGALVNIGTAELSGLPPGFL